LSKIILQIMQEWYGFFSRSRHVISQPESTPSRTLLVESIP
jgi:hypothetical protein